LPYNKGERREHTVKCSECGKGEIVKNTFHKHEADIYVCDQCGQDYRVDDDGTVTAVSECWTCHGWTTNSDHTCDNCKYDAWIDNRDDQDRW
jgi:hypothetical protein